MRYNSQSVGTIIIVMLLAVAIPFTMGFGPLDQLLEKKDESKEKKDTSKEGTKEGGSDSILGTIGGAVGGGAVGAGIGEAVGGKKGAIIGGAVGAVAGAIIGNYVTKQIRDRQQAVAAKGYRPDQGILLTMDEVSATPNPIKAGTPLNMFASYTVLTPNNENNEKVKVKEIREIRHKGEVVETHSDEFERTVGSVGNTVPITLKDLKPGKYELVTTVAYADKTAQSKTNFTVQ